MKEDNIDSRIERVISDVASKKEQMARWDTMRRAGGKAFDRRKRRIVVISAAACVLVLAGVSVSRFIYRSSGDVARDVMPVKEVSFSSPAGNSKSAVSNPQRPPRRAVSRTAPSGSESSSDSPAIRGGIPDVDGIETLMSQGKYDMALAAIDVAMADTVIDGRLPRAEREYQRELLAYRNRELKWLRIQSLVELGREAEAVAMLRDYVKEQGPHRVDAEILLKQLVKRKK